MQGYRELSVHETNPFEIIEEFISGEISDYEAYLEAMKVQNEYQDVKKRIQAKLEKQIDVVSQYEPDLVKKEKQRQDLETLKENY